MVRLTSRSGRLCAAALIALGSAAAPASGQQLDSAATRLVDVDGHAMRVRALGLERRTRGRPIVVFEAGATNSLEAWNAVVSRVAAFAPVVAYDRSGLGRSAWDGITPTPRHVTNRLRRLLETIGAEPPYVLVGHSWGGMLARYFAGYHPHDIAGLVLVDPAPMITQSLEDNLTPFNAVGAGRAGFDAFWSGYAAFFVNSPPAVRAEFGVFTGLLTKDLDERDLRPLPDVPLVVLVAAKPFPSPPSLSLPYDPRAQFDAELRYRIGVLQEWALGSSRGMVVVSNHVSHVIPREDPELVAWAVRHVLAPGR